MSIIHNTSTQRFMGTNIVLYLKNGEKIAVGDGLILTDGEKIHIWPGKKMPDGKFIMPADSVRAVGAKQLNKMTYHDNESGKLITLSF